MSDEEYMLYLSEANNTLQAKGKAVRNSFRKFIVMKKADVAGFTHSVDREYFSRPVEVTIVASYLHTPKSKTFMVRDERRGHTYPANSANLKSHYELTKRELAAIGE